MTENNLQYKIFQLFTAKNKEIFVVGGTVRDALLSDRCSEPLPDGKNALNLSVSENDLDFATNAKPNEIVDILEKAGFKTHLIGVAFGTVSIIDNGRKAEITTYRKNENYRRDNRHPTLEWGVTIEEDLARRDFCFNAIAIDKNGIIVDPYNGIECMRNGLISTPIDANITFSEDPLRILRAIRFKTKFGFKYSDNVKNALRNHVKRLLILSHERILDEMNKILMTDNVYGALSDLCEYRLINYFIPELMALKNIKQPKEYHHKDALAHTIQVVQNAPKDLTLRWAALFHDLGKPATYTQECGAIHFYDHDELGSRIAQSIMYRMGFSKQTIKDVTYLVRNHMRANLYESAWSDAAIRRFIRETGEYCDKLLILSRADVTSHNPRTVAFHLSSLDEFAKRIEEQRDFKESPICPISGYEIMEYFDLPPCRKVGEIKNLILNAIISGKLKVDDCEETILKYTKQKLSVRSSV